MTQIISEAQPRVSHIYTDHLIMFMLTPNNMRRHPFIYIFIPMLCAGERGPKMRKDPRRGELVKY